MTNSTSKKSRIVAVLLPLAVLLSLVSFLARQACAGSEAVPANMQETATQFEFVKPIVEAPDCNDLLLTMQDILKSLEQGDFDKFAGFLDDDAYMIDQGTRALTAGKQAVIDKLKKERQGGKHLVKFRLYDVFPQVVKDRAIVLSSITKEYSGSAAKLHSRATDVFVKKDGKWKLVEHHTNWKKSSS